MKDNQTLNSNLHNAKRQKNDEFYTRLTDIEKELKHYKEHFKGKTVYCNCDDARSSNFFKFFSLKFEDYGLKKLITTSYNPNGHGTVFVYEGDKNGNRMPDDSEIKVTELKGNGDFRSEECVEILKEADIVVTNPPFSLFRDYIRTLVENDKKFLILGNNNAITYKEIFPLIKENKLWLGYADNKTMEFGLPEYYERWDRIEVTRGGGYQKIGRVPAISWFTNLQHGKRNEELILYRHYTPEAYPKYDNYDAIEVSKVTDIPEDYYGVMGVPITFLGKYNPMQFEIVEFRKGADGKDLVYSSRGGGRFNLTSEYSSVDADRWIDEQSERYGCEWEKQVCKNTHSSIILLMTRRL